MATPRPYGYLNDLDTAYRTMNAPLGSCHAHGGTDDPADCEWCNLRRLMNDEPCYTADVA